MIRRNPPAALPAFAGLGAVALLGLFCGPNPGAGAPRPAPAKHNLRLRTDALPTPLVVPGDTLKRRVTLVEIRGELDGDGDAKGAVTLDESAFRFNEFGDAIKVATKESKPSPVIFRRVKIGDDSVKRRLYE